MTRRGSSAAAAAEAVDAIFAAVFRARHAVFAAATGAAFAATGTGWVVRTAAAATAVRDRLTGDIARKTISAVTANGRGSADPNGSGSTTAPGFQDPDVPEPPAKPCPYSPLNPD